MGATFQPIAFQIRSGPQHFDWKTGDPWTVCCTGTPEWSDAGEGGIHLYGAISWYEEDHTAVMDIVRQCKAEGYAYCRWERIDPETGDSRPVRIGLMI